MLPSWSAVRRIAPFVSISLLAIFLLFYKIQARALWMDEAAVLLYLPHTAWDFLRAYFIFPDNHPPLYYLLVIIVYPLVQHYELGIRLVSVLAALGTLVYLYYFSLLVSTQKSKALLAVAIASTSSYFILIGQMARYHSLAALTTLAALYYFTKLLYTPYTRRVFWGFVIASMAVVYTDYPHFIYLELIVNAYVLYALVRHKLPFSLGKWMLAEVVVALVSLPSVYLLYNRVVYQGDGGFQKMNALGNGLINIVGGFCMHFYAFFFGENIFPWDWVVFVPGLALLVTILYLLLRALRRGELSGAFRFTLFCLFALVLLNSVILNKIDPRYNFLVYPKFVFAAYPFFALVLAHGAYLFRPRWRTVAIIIILAVNCFGLVQFYHRANYINPSYFNSKESLHYVADHAQAGDILIISGDANEGLYQLYRNTYFAKLHPVSLDEAKNAARNKTHQRFWFFATASDDGNANNTTDSKVPAGFTIISRLDTTPLNPMFKMLKQKVLKYESYTYKNSLYLLSAQ